MSNTISTFETGLPFNDAMTLHIETLGQDLSVMYDDSGEFTIEQRDGESFTVHACPTSEIPEGTLVGGLFIMETEAPTVEVDGVEYTLIRQW